MSDSLQREGEALAVAIRALSYYANERNWSADDWDVRAVIAEYGKAGQKARNALRRIDRMLEPQP